MWRRMEKKFVKCGEESYWMRRSERQLDNEAFLIEIWFSAALLINLDTVQRTKCMQFSNWD
jgi:hypothetical protein